MAFDPNAAAPPGSGIFGLPHRPDEARYLVIPVPFDATTSFRDGTRMGPAAVLAASRQVDLFDLDFGRPWEHGIAMLPLASGMARTVAMENRAARRDALPILHAGGAHGDARLARALARVNAAGARVNEAVESATARALDRGQTPLVLGGDHSTPFGCIRAVAARFPGLGILHIDAHADLRDAYEGFAWSHASIMHNVAHRIGAAGGVATLVQVGLRDVGEDEVALIRSGQSTRGTRIAAFFDGDLARRRFQGETWAAQSDAIVRELPALVYVSFDIDGLDPALCPDTGTPVPGGLGFNEATALLRAVVASGRRIVGADLNEVAPSPRTTRAALGADVNAIVGARILYKLIGAMAASAAHANRASGTDTVSVDAGRRTAGSSGRPRRSRR